MVQGEARGHYKDIAAYYDTVEGHLYEDRADIACRWLNLQPTDKLVDIGAGTGTLSSLIWKKAGLQSPVLAVDPSPHMLEFGKDKEGIETMLASFDEFLESPGELISKYNKFVCMGTIHYIPQLPNALKKLYDSLKKDDQFLIIEKPETLLFDAAKKVSRKSSVNENEEYLKKAGFSKIKRGEETYFHNYNRDQFFDKLHNRCYSVLTLFTDQEIEEGIKELNETVFKGAEYMELSDVNCLLLATK